MTSFLWFSLLAILLELNRREHNEKENDDV
jgi:hypothetical protein